MFTRSAARNLTRTGPLSSRRGLRLPGMAGCAETPRARVELVGLAGDDRVVDLGPLPCGGPCDGALVDDLLRFDLAARRLGWRLRLLDVDPHLVELLLLVGVADRVL